MNIDVDSLVIQLLECFDLEDGETSEPRVVLQSLANGGVMLRWAVSHTFALVQPPAATTKIWIFTSVRMAAEWRRVMAEAFNSPLPYEGVVISSRIGDFASMPPQQYLVVDDMAANSRMSAYIERLAVTTKCTMLLVPAFTLLSPTRLLGIYRFAFGTHPTAQAHRLSLCGTIHDTPQLARRSEARQLAQQRQRIRMGMVMTRLCDVAISSTSPAPIGCKPVEVLFEPSAAYLRVLLFLEGVVAQYIRANTPCHSQRMVRQLLEWSAGDVDACSGGFGMNVWFPPIAAGNVHMFMQQHAGQTEHWLQAKSLVGELLIRSDPIGGDGNGNCPVCREQWADCMAFTVTVCGHVVCGECFLRGALSHRRCIVCRVSLVEVDTAPPPYITAVQCRGSETASSSRFLWLVGRIITLPKPTLVLLLVPTDSLASIYRYDISNCGFTAHSQLAKAVARQRRGHDVVVCTYPSVHGFELTAVGAAFVVGFHVPNLFQLLVDQGLAVDLEYCWHENTLDTHNSSQLAIQAFL